MTTAIVGFSGRKGEEADEKVYQYMMETVLGSQPQSLVSGGCSWADHVAVSLFLQGKTKNLTLHLPSEWMEDQFDPRTMEGAFLNELHRKFSLAVGFDSLKQLREAKEKGASFH